MVEFIILSFIPLAGTALGAFLGIFNNFNNLTNTTNNKRF